MNKKHLYFLALIILPMLASLACRFSAADPTATPRVVIDPEFTGETEEPTPPPIEEPTEIIQTEETAAPSSQEEFQDLVRLEKSMWIQDGDTVFVAFFLQNPNSNLLFEDVEYTVSLFGQNGEEIDSDYSSIRWIFPEQTLGITFKFKLADETITVGSTSVDWVYDNTSAADGFTYPYVVQNVQFWANNGDPMVTGKIQNQHMETYTGIRNNIIVYNNAGEIVGGGHTIIDFTPGQDFMGFASRIDTFDDVASVEIYPTFSYYTSFYDAENLWSIVSVQDSYFYEGDFGNILGGALIKNESSSVLRNSIVYATFYDDAGNVASAGPEKVGILLPGATLGVTPFVVKPPEGTNAVDFDLLVLPGEVVEAYELTENPFVVNNTALAGDYNEYVRVNFTNTFTQQASDANIYVQLYNAEGQIIGGGNGWTTDPIPAGGSMDVEVFVSYSNNKTVDRIEAWVVPSTFTEFE